MVEYFIDHADPPEVKGRIAGAIAPHAGYVYSGAVAGFTYRALRDNAVRHPITTAIILGFTHRSSFRGVALMDGDAIRTPLGETALDQETGRALIEASSKAARWHYSPHFGEWSAENQIPFVQAALPNTRLVVGLFGDHDHSTVTAMIHALATVTRNQSFVIIASTDMLHDPDYAKVTRIDHETLKLTSAMDAASIGARWSGDEQIFCGLMPVLTVLGTTAALGCRKGTLLHYRNSGDDFPESRGEWVVGYGSMVFTVS